VLIASPFTIIDLAIGWPLKPFFDGSAYIASRREK
jgi:hypothetical protein